MNRFQRVESLKSVVQKPEKNRKSTMEKLSKALSHLECAETLQLTTLQTRAVGGSFKPGGPNGGI